MLFEEIVDRLQISSTITIARNIGQTVGQRFSHTVILTYIMTLIHQIVLKIHCKMNALMKIGQNAWAKVHYICKCETIGPSCPWSLTCEWMF